MGERTFIKNFGGNKGLDLKKADVASDPSDSKLFTNCELTTNDSLTKRKGMRVGGQCRTNGQNWPESGIFTYTYRDSATGATKQELIGATTKYSTGVTQLPGLSRLVNGSLVISYTGGGATTASFSFYPNGTTAFVAELKANGVVVKTVTLNNGTAIFTTLESLRSQLTGVFAGHTFAAVLTPSAQINGNQVGVSVITVDAGHTFSIGQSALLNDSSVPVEKSVWITNTAATTLTFTGNPINVQNNEFIGISRLNAEVVPTTIDLDVLVSGTVVIEYWERIKSSVFSTLTNVVPFQDTTLLLPGFTNVSFVNSRNNVYFSQDRSTSSTQRPILKYDGNAITLAGLPTPILATPTVGAGGAVDVGTHTYIFQYTRTDNRGNIITSNPSLPQTITTTAGNQAVSIVIPGLAGTGYETSCGQISVGAGPTNSIAFTASNLSVGDTIYLYDTITASYVTRNIVSSDSASLTMDGAAVTYVAGGTVNHNFVSNNARVAIWRTKLGTNEYFLVEEVPFFSTGQTYVDVIADANLVTQFIPFDDTPHDPPPSVNYLCEHQNCLVGGGDKFNPNTVYWSLQGSPEYFPSDNQVDIPSSQQGTISALASDTDDMLAVFKPDSYYNLVGDLNGGNYSTLKVSEGDFGCPAHAAIQKIRGTLIFPTNRGFVLLRGGQMVYEFSDPLSPVFTNNYYEQNFSTVISANDTTKLVVLRATAVNDFDSQRYICHIPAESGATGTPGGGPGTQLPNANSKCYAWDYKNSLWQEFTDNDVTISNASGGMAIYKNQLYWNARIDSGGAAVGLLLKRTNLGNSYDFYSNTAALAQDFEPNWDNLGEPSLEKQFLWLKVYSMDDFYAFAANTLTIQVYTNYDSTNPAYTTTIPYTSINQREEVIKLPNIKARAILFRFSNSVAGQRSLITGYEYCAIADYEREALKK